MPRSALSDDEVLGRQTSVERGAANTPVLDSVDFTDTSECHNPPEGRPKSRQRRESPLREQ